LNFKYDEEEYGKQIYTNGFQTDYTNSELTILVKYLKEVKKFKRKETEDFLYEFCKKYIKGFNKISYYKAIDRAILKGRRGDNKLVTIKSIPIFKEELIYIDSLEITHEYKKLLLSFLVNKKISLTIKDLHYGSNEMSTYFEGNKKRYEGIFKSANIVEKLKVDEMIHELVSKGVIQSVIKGSIILDYLYSIYKVREETIQVMNKKTEEIEDKIKKIIEYDIKDYELYEEINDLDNIGYIFDFYKEVNNVKRCDQCQCYIKLKSVNSKAKYCVGCAKIIKNEQNKRYIKDSKDKIGKCEC